MNREVFKFILLTFLFMGMLSANSCAASSLQPGFEEVISLDQVQSRVEKLSKQLDPGLNMTWSPVLTPGFPAQWPPTKETMWIRYAYAQGQEFPPSGLVDAVRISAPWLKIELKPGNNNARLILLKPRLEPVDTQGVFPILAADGMLLKKREEMVARALGLSTPINPNDPNFLEFKKYYQLWLKTNGAIASQLEPSHRDFFQFIRN